MNDTDKKTANYSKKQELIFGIDNETHLDKEKAWHKDNLDIVIPALIIIAGLFQFILRKWISPVSEDVISKLEDQFPTQGLIYQTEFRYSNYRR